ncbi:MAG: M20/M25/M40 family metallo-hydrolase [Bryobacteraceae bacterium]
MAFVLRWTLILLLTSAGYSFAADPPQSINPEIQTVVSEISADRIAEIEKRLESFGTRNIYSTTNDPAHGIGAAREWIAAQFKSYSPKLQVSFDKHGLVGDPSKRLFKNVEIWNVVATLPGTTEPEHQVMVSGHYDTINMVNKTGPDGKRQLDPEATVAAVAPGVTDDGSGTAAVMELARVMSQRQFRKTIVFIAFAAEEYGLLGSSLYAESAAAKHRIIDGLFNNDIIGSDVTGNGQTTTRYVNVYSNDPEDSVSRQLARYLKETAERYQPGFEINLVFRHDRFGRGGDHSPFAAAGYPAIRITTPAENFSNQHTATDTFANTSPAYATLVAKANAAALTSRALAPKTPEIKAPPPTAGRSFASPLSRGASEKGYDAIMNWSNPKPEQDLAGYAVVIRKTTSPIWEREIFVGEVLTYKLPNINIDEVVLGVRAIDKDGNESPVAAYVTPPYKQAKIPTY